MPSEGGFAGNPTPLQICAEATSNPTTDGVNVVFTDMNGNTLTNTYADPNGDPNSYCVSEDAPLAPQANDQMYATATDNVNGKTASATSNLYPWMQSTGF